LAKAL